MSGNIGIIFCIAGAALAAACSASSGAVGWTNADGGGSSSGTATAGGGTSSGSTGSGGGSGGAASSSSGSTGSDASATTSSDSSTPDATTAGADGGSRADGSSADAARTDGASPGTGAGGDGGAQPYRGVANSACADLTTLGVSWWFNWNTGPSRCAKTEFVPMVWGHTGNEQTMSGITNEISAIVNAGYKNVLGFNEADNASQSNLSVATAISLWPAFNNPAVRIGSPSTQGNSAGLTWIQNFMSQVNADTTGNLRVDFISTHWYGWNAGSCDMNATNLETWIRGIEAIPGNRPIWITEFGCLNQSNPSAAVVQAFLSGAIAMLARHPRIERYAWYPWTTNNELLTNGALTSLGTVYAAAPAYK